MPRHVVQRHSVDDRNQGGVQSILRLRLTNAFESGCVELMIRLKQMRQSWGDEEDHSLEVSVLSQQLNPRKLAEKLIRVLGGLLPYLRSRNRDITHQLLDVVDQQCGCWPGTVLLLLLRLKSEVQWSALSGEITQYFVLHMVGVPSSYAWEIATMP